MKLSVAIAGDNALPSAFVVWRGFESSIVKAAKAGYQGVELALKTPKDFNPASLKQILSHHEIEVSAISTGQVFGEMGYSLTDENESIRQKTYDILKELVYLAADFGGIVNLGRVRGSIVSEKSEDYFIQMASKLCDTAEKMNVNIVLEPVNRYEINFINNLDQGSALLKKINKKNMGLMPDVFHMNIEDDSITGSLQRNSQYVKYIHLADSNRLAPGQGHLNFAEIFSTLAQIHYDNWVSVEILPHPDPDTAAKAAVNYLRPFLLKKGGVQ